MHPTPEEQLQAILRLIDLAAGDPEMAAETKSTLADASRLVRRLERSLAIRLPFLADDNELAAELLTALAAQLPTLAEGIATATSDLPIASETKAHQTNKRLQELLGQAIHLLPDNAAGNDGRARISDHLRTRIAADPALNRSPAERRPSAIFE